MGAKRAGTWGVWADRAKATRREVVLGGLEDNKIIRVVGLGSAVLAKPDQPFDAANRRVSIVVMNKVTEYKVGRDGVDLEATEAAPITNEAIASAQK